MEDMFSNYMHVRSSEAESVVHMEITDLLKTHLLFAHEFQTIEFEQEENQPALRIPAYELE
jgi:hypothetical protein